MRELLTLSDFKNTKIDPNWDSFDKLLEVAKVAQQKLQKKHDFPQFLPSCFQESECVGRKFALKRKAKDVDHDDKDWEGEGFKLNYSKRSKKNHKPEVSKNFPPPPVPDLPDSFKQHIAERMGGSGSDLVIQKKIFFSDVNPVASRFTIPFSQIKTFDFLTETEAEYLQDGTKNLKVCLLQPCMKPTEVTFKRWKYSGKSSSYVLTTTWNSIVERNQIKEDDMVQLWSFRVKSKLCFALVKVPKSQR